MLPSLAPNETAILAFSNDWVSEVATLSSHTVHVPSNVLGYNVTAAGSLAVHAKTGSLPSDHLLKLSNGKTFNISANTALSSFSLNSWKLVAEHWEAPHMSVATIVAEKHNTTHHFNSLVSWLDIPGLQNASGVGYYSTQFSWPPTTSNSTGSIDGAYI
ncbi:hypothetical protein N7509_010789 [Penicillium cosmopolitanum]|uniref:Uncharacterized protein n=1 Tax=Penicillium cosmopolitanum TaxID=1131564 RepID=A0A9X0B4W9_9EURO|nr:uncharacterized protein N7509_010789 [Penicillium cosmopolitanum]KAJ5388248.1 hypothetical protein N7509_010789 [Penicillium cosmopolitanum]